MKYYYKVAIIYTLILFLDRIDLTIVNVAIPELTEKFNIPIGLSEWFSVSFLIGLSIAISVSSWLGEVFGYKRVFIFSVLSFALFSLGCSEAQSFQAFIISRFLHGFFGGIIISCGNGILYMSCKKEDYAKVTNFVFLPTLIAPAIAPFLGGIIIKYSSYKWIFYINLPICLLVAFLSVLFIKNEHKFDKVHLDIKGFVLSSVIFIIFFVATSFISQGKFFNSIPLFIFSGALFYVFIKIESAASNPIFDFSYLKRTLFKKALLIQLFFQMSHFGSFFIIGLFLQSGIGFSTIHTGLILGMQAVGAIIVSIPSKKTYYIFGPGKTIGFGMLGVALVTPLILLIDSANNILLAGIIMLFRGLCSGWVGTPLQTIGMIDSSSRDVDVGRMGSMFTVARQISISLGVCVGGMSLGISSFYHKIDYLNGHMSYGQSISVFSLGVLTISVFCLIGSRIAFSINK